MHVRRILSLIMAGTMLVSNPVLASATDNSNSESTNSLFSEEDNANEGDSETDSEASSGSGAEESEEGSEDGSESGSEESSESASGESSESGSDGSSEASSEASSSEEADESEDGASKGASGEEAASDASSAASSGELTPEEEAKKKEKEKDAKKTDKDKLLEDKYYTGYVPEENPIEITHNEPKDPSMSLFGVGQGYPSKYVTSSLPGLRDQSPYGTCWAFATTSLLEINLMKKGLMSSPDLSELHLSYFTYNSVVDPLGGTEGDYIITEKARLLNRGGNYRSALFTLADWRGAADENTARYDRDDALSMSSGLQDAIAYDDVAHVQSYYVDTVGLSDFRSSKDLSILNPVKKMIYEHGAAGISFAALNGFIAVTDTDTYNQTYNCYYNPKPSTTNHAVAIVGWDDNFSKNNFSTTPPGDGAFLIRNSWTTGENSTQDSFAGYFWMSYYEATIEDRFYSVDVELADKYDNNYEYDGSDGTYTSGSYETAANIFTAHAENGVNGEELKAVSFYSTGTNVSYTIEIYTDVVDNPESGNLVSEATTSGTIDFSGMHTITLNNSVYLEPGCKFAVVVKADSYCILKEYAYSNDTSGASSKPGESYYIMYNGWEDAGTSGNFYIKAFTCNVDSSVYVAPTDISFENVTDNKLQLNVGEVFKVVPKIMPASATDRSITWSSSNESVAKVVNGQIEPLAEGSATITASLAGGKVKRDIAITVKNGLLGIALKVSQIYDFTGGGTYKQYSLVYNPKNYIPQGKVTFESSDEEVVSVDENGKLTEKMMGEAVITVSVDGKSAYDTYTVKPSWDFFDYEVTDDKVVTLKWKGGKYISDYRVYRNGEYLATIPDEGKKNYTYVDNYFKGKSDKTAEYYFGTTMNGHTSLYSYTIVLGKNYKVTYYLNGGTQNPNNPDTYISGRSYSLSNPTPPNGYDFAGWYSDPECTNWKSSIETSDTGDLKFYAKFTPKQPTLTIKPNYLSLSRGGSAQVTATYEPASGSMKYNWKSDNEKIAKVTANGNTATITAGNELGDTVIIVDCNGLSTAIGVSVQQIIEFEQANVSIKASDGDSKLSVKVANEYSGKPIVWKSSDESVATVKDGVVHPVGTHKDTKSVIITATISGTDFSATCEVSIIPSLTAEAPKGSVDGTSVKDNVSEATSVAKGALFALTSATKGATIYYALGGKEPSVGSDGKPSNQDTKLYSEALRIDSDTTVKALSYKAGSAKSEVKTFILKIRKDDRGDIQAALWKSAFKEDSTNVPTGVWYTFEQNKDEFSQIYTAPEKTTQVVATTYHASYTGTAITVKDNIYVYHGTRRLIEGRDYILTYKNNTVAAKASDKKAPSVTVKGKGNYASTAIFAFFIDPISINNAEITSETEVAVMAAKNAKLASTKPVLKYSGKTLSVGKDYTISYREGDRNGKAVDPAKTILSAAGKTYTIVVSGNGCFSGTMDQTVTIKTKDPKTTVSATKLKITDAKGKSLKFKYNYNSNGVNVKELFDDHGGSVTPVARVMNGKTVLRYGVDYTVRTATGVDTVKAVGKHGVIIEGLDTPDGNGISYYGTKTETLEIVGVQMSKVKIAGLATAVEYTGKRIGFNINTGAKRLESDLGTVTLNYTDSSKRTTTLTPSTDGVSGHYTVSYPNMDNPGKYTIEFKGIEENGYTGTVKKAVTVKAFNLKTNAKNRLKITVDDAVFTKAGAKPAVKVQFTVDNNSDGSANAPITLREGIDYTLTYKNNTKVADKSAKNAPTVTIKGIGNYTGSNASKTFTISKAPITSVYLMTADVKYNAKGKKGYFLTVPKLYQNDKPLAVGKGKDVEALNKNDIEYTYGENTVLGNNVRKYDGEVVSPTDQVRPGTVIRVSIKTAKLSCSAASSFKHEASERSTIEGYYRVVDSAKSISSYKVELRDKNKPFFNNGNAIALKESDLRVSKNVKGKTEELKVTDYQIKSITNNRFIGTATVTIEGRGNYNGTKTLTIKIGARKISGK